MIAFTSQLAHVVSSAYIKSPEADKHNGYSAGSYKDLTRVAKLNETMWSELFLCNAEPLAQEIDEIITHLDEYRRAIRRGRPRNPDRAAARRPRTQRKIGITEKTAPLGRFFLLPNAMLSQKCPHLICELLLQMNQPLGDILGFLAGGFVLIEVAIE